VAEDAASFVVSLDDHNASHTEEDATTCEDDGVTAVTYLDVVDTSKAVAKATATTVGGPGHWENECDIKSLEENIQSMQAKLTRIQNERKQYVNTVELSAQSDHVQEQEEEEDQETETLESCMAAFDLGLSNKTWLLDSGATSHMTSDRELIQNLTNNFAPGQNVTTAGGQQLPVKGQGDVKIQANGEIKTISKVLYVNSIKANLLFVGRFTDLGYLVAFSNSQCIIFDK